MTEHRKGSIMDRKTKESTMKIRKVLALAGVTLLAAGVLAACSGGSGAKGEQTFAFTYGQTQIISTI